MAAAKRTFSKRSLAELKRRGRDGKGNALDGRAPQAEKKTDGDD